MQDLTLQEFVRHLRVAKNEDSCLEQGVDFALAALDYEHFVTFMAKECKSRHDARSEAADMGF